MLTASVYYGAFCLGFAVAKMTVKVVKRVRFA